MEAHTEDNSDDILREEAEHTARMEQTRAEQARALLECQARLRQSWEMLDDTAEELRVEQQRMGTGCPAGGTLGVCQTGLSR